MEKKVFLKRFISVGLTSAMVFSVCTSNCFAMRGRGYETLKMVQGMRPKPCSIGPTRPIPHTKYEVARDRVTSFECSWVELGITVATSAIGSAGVKVALSNIGNKGRAVILSSTMKAFGSIPGLEKAIVSAIAAAPYVDMLIRHSTDLNKHGVRFTVYVTYETSGNCTCSISKDHGDRQLFPQVRIQATTY